MSTIVKTPMSPPATVRAFLYGITLSSLEKRHADLTRISGAEMADICVPGLPALRASGPDAFSVDGLAAWDGAVVLHAESLTGRGGKPYLRLETDRGGALYFPRGKFGAFIKASE